MLKCQPWFLRTKNHFDFASQKSWVGKRATQACLMSVYFRKKDRQTDGQTDRQTPYTPRGGLPRRDTNISGLREEVSRLVAATCQKSYALRKRATQACLMSVYFRKKDRQTDGQTDRQTPYTPRGGLPRRDTNNRATRGGNPSSSCHMPKKAGLDTRLKKARNA